MDAIRRFFSQAWLYQKGNAAEFNLLEFASFDVMAQLFGMFFYIIVASYSFGTMDLTRWVVGNAFLICVMRCIFELSMTFTNERRFGRLRAIVVSPTNDLTVVFQRGFYTILLGFLSVAIGFAFGALVFHIDFSKFNLPAFSLAILVATFSCAGMGILISTFGLLSDSIFFINNTAVYVVMLFSGANFPLSQFPVPIQWLANLFPLNHGIRAGNLCFGENIGIEYFQLLAIEACIGVAYFIAAFIVLKIATRIAVKNATLEVF